MSYRLGWTGGDAYKGPYWFLEHWWRTSWGEEGFVVLDTKERKYYLVPAKEWQNKENALGPFDQLLDAQIALETRVLLNATPAEWKDR